MNLTYRHILFLTGYILAVSSFFYFAADQDRYYLLLLFGLLVSFVSFCVILAKKDTLKSKLIWISIIVALCLLERLIEPFIIRLSYKNFVIDNYSVLEKVSHIMSSKQGNFLICQDSNIWIFDNFESNEERILRQGLNPDKVIFVSKDYEKIFFCTYSMLDVQKGVYYFYDLHKADSRYRHLIGKWYM